MKKIVIFLLLIISFIGGCMVMNEEDEISLNETSISFLRKAQKIPSSYLISGILWHEQMNASFCGPASIEMVFDYFGPDINQKPIADVARTSNTGTWSPDIVRTGQFSYLSSAQGNYFPNEAPEAGFDERPLGYAAFAYSSENFWLNDLMALIYSNIPVIVLVTYTPEGGGGHYRVAIGYDDNEGVIYLLDPWGRDQNHQTNWTGVVKWTYSEFQQSWNYLAEGNEHPYWGSIILPWSVSLNYSGRTKAGSNINLTANITYPCPAPFNCSEFPASEVTATITLPSGMSLNSGSNTVSLGSLGAGNSVEASWSIYLEDNPAGKTISVTAGGTVSGSVPAIYSSNNNLIYPAYDYVDMIGGSGEINF